LGVALLIFSSKNNTRRLRRRAKLLAVVGWLAFGGVYGTKCQPDKGTAMNVERSVCKKASDWNTA
jgi:hypothetical protein